MYTRFKSQKSGIKHGLNTITSNSSRSTRIVVPTPLTDHNKKHDLNNNSINNSINMPVSALMTTASIVLNDEINLTEPSGDSCQVDKQTVPSVLLNTFQMDKKDSAPAPKKKVKKIVVEEPVDPVCISYVKSLWEKYCDEIGTDNGPIKHVDENKAQDYPHLNNFVAFDMEHWWAERSISCMINESPQPAEEAPLKPFKREASAEEIKSSQMNSCFNSKLNQSWSSQKSIQGINLSQLIIC